MIGIYVGAHPNPRFHSTRTFFVRRLEVAAAASAAASASASAAAAAAAEPASQLASRSKGDKDEDFSYVRCVGNILSSDTKAVRAICLSLQQVSSLAS